MNTQIKEVRYYDLPVFGGDISRAKDLSEIRNEMLHTMDLHLQSDVPIGLALSGGIDSSILASYYAQKSEFKAYSLRFNDVAPEKHLIEETVRDLGLNHQYVEVSEFENIETIEKIIDHIGKPFRASQTIYQYALRNAASKDGIRVFITGDGADEVFAGYSYSVPYAIADMLSDHRDSEAVQMANSMELFTGIAAEELLKSANHILVSGINYGSPIELDEKLFKKEANEITRDNKNKVFGMSDFLRHRLLISPIPYWLAVEDSISMMTSIESRVPYLDHELINVAWKFNKDKFITNSVTKFPLRACMDSYIPDHVINEKVKFQRPGRDSYLV